MEPDGTVSHAGHAIGSRVGLGVDEACIEAWRRVQFVPAQRDGEAVADVIIEECEVEDGEPVSARDSPSQVWIPTPLTGAPEQAAEPVRIPAPKTETHGACAVTPWRASALLVATAMAGLFRRRG